MPLIKTSKLLKELKLARAQDPDPIATAHRFTIDGFKAAIASMEATGRMDHPWAGLSMWMTAYANHPDLRYPLAEAFGAMDKLHRALLKVPPEVWEARLRDPKRSVEGYSADAFNAGAASFGYPLDHAYAHRLLSDHLAAKRAPKVKAPKPPPIASRDAWIKPGGMFIPVGFEQHLSWCEENDTTEETCERAGWVKLSSGRVYLHAQPTKRQWTTLFDWCAHHGKDYAAVEAAAVKLEAGERTFVQVFDL